MAASTITTSNVTPHGWVTNAYNADWSGCEIAKALVAGKSHYIESITINCASAITVTVGAGETASAVTTTILGPIVFTANGNQFTHTFTRPVKVASATDITADAFGAGATCIIISGFTQ